MAIATAQLRMTAEAFQLGKSKNDRIEDCHFIFHAPECGGATTIGVADGVGGHFRERGIDPGEYAEELMMNALATVIESSNVVDPIKILKEAHSKTAKPGASTACIITMAADGGELRFANVGDSGFKVFRRNAVVYESPIQQKGFNHPFQLYEVEEDRKLVEERAVEGTVKVEAGDVVVAGTDGLFDNLYGWEIARILENTDLEIHESQPMELDEPEGIMDSHQPMKLEEGPNNHTQPIMESARVIGLTAFRNSLDKEYVSQFQTESLKHGRNHRGGKPDDITVVVAKIESVP